MTEPEHAAETSGPWARAEAGVEVILKWSRSTSRRNFALVPLVALLDQPLRRRRLQPLGLLPMTAGYLLYLLGGRYRIRLGGGGPGLSGPPPDRLVTTGIYSLTRNPMYSGHVVYLFGVALLTSSPAALAFAVGTLPWFSKRVKDDEQRLAALFGEEYQRYRNSVPRWGVDLGRLSAAGG